MNAGAVLVTDGVKYLGLPLALAFDKRRQTCVFIASTILTVAADKVNQVYNVAVGDRSTLNDLYGMMKTLLSGNFAHVPHMSRNTSISAVATYGTRKRTFSRRPRCCVTFRPIVSTTACAKRWTGMSMRSLTDAASCFPNNE
jgi:hypothetical protein